MEIIILKMVQKKPKRKNSKTFIIFPDSHYHKNVHLNEKYMIFVVQVQQKFGF